MSHDASSDALPSPVAPRHSLEVAVYNVHAAQADAFPAVQAAVHAMVRTFPGFRAAERLRGLDDPTLFADYVLWESHEAAQRAAALLPTLPEAATFLRAIATMRTFGHLPADAPPGPAGASAPVTLSHAP